MRRWLLALRKSTIHAPPRRFAGFHARLCPHPRCLSTVAGGGRSYDFERVAVQCASSGNIDVDLYNMAGIESTNAPILIYLPPYSTVSSGGEDVQGDLDPPPFCRRFPTAVVHYRWAGSSPFEVVDEGSSSDNGSSESADEDPDDEFPLSSQRAEDVIEKDGSLNNRNTALHWPTPFFDTMRAYDWIVSNLAPPVGSRRAVYACGSYLGAPMAAALALTESWMEEPMAVQGCITFNGIYDWTTLLPDHPMNRPRKKSLLPSSDVFEGKPRDAGFEELKWRVAALFGSPENLFDPLASPSLFFYNPGLNVPRSFNEPTDFRKLWRFDKTLTPEQRFEHQLSAPLKPPKMSPRKFPPQKSTLRFPDMLLLHTKPPPSAGPSRFVPSSSLQRRMRKPTSLGMHTFRGQAEELAGAAWKSINKERRDEDEDVKKEKESEEDEEDEEDEEEDKEEDYDGPGNEATERVEIYEVEPLPGAAAGADVPLGLPASANKYVEEWLEDRLPRSD